MQRHEEQGIRIIPRRVHTVEDCPGDDTRMIAELRQSGFDSDWYCVDTGAAYRAYLLSLPAHPIGQQLAFHLGKRVIYRVFMPDGRP
jgi:hypothetical protein